MRRRFILGLLLLMLTGCGADREGVEFDRLVKPSTPNTYLVCPPDRCAVAAASAAPVFDLPASALFDRVRQTLAAQPRTEIVQDQGDRRRLVLVQRSRVFRFPDTITVQIFELPAGRSTLAVYSASNYGRGDFGVNEARVRDWLALVAAAAPTPG